MALGTSPPSGGAFPACGVGRDPVMPDTDRAAVTGRTGASFERKIALRAVTHAALPDLGTVVVAVGGGGLFAGVTTAAVDSVTGDSLGARRASATALHW